MIGDAEEEIDIAEKLLQIIDRVSQSARASVLASALAGARMHGRIYGAREERKRCSEITDAFGHRGLSALIRAGEP